MITVSKSNQSRKFCLIFASSSYSFILFHITKWQRDCLYSSEPSHIVQVFILQSAYISTYVFNFKHNKSSLLYQIDWRTTCRNSNARVEWSLKKLRENQQYCAQLILSWDGAQFRSMQASIWSWKPTHTI